MSEPQDIVELDSRVTRIEARQEELFSMLRQAGVDLSAIELADETPIDAKEAALLFGVKEDYLYRHARKIRHVREYTRIYFYPSAVREFLAEKARRNG